MKLFSVRRCFTSAYCLALLFAALSYCRPLNATTFTVTTTNLIGVGSLRQALLDANTNVGLDTISFNIPFTETIISPTNALPSIVDSVIIDGTTQPGFAGTPIIELNGVSAGAGVDGIKIVTSNCVIRSLVINRFLGDGIEIATNGNNLVEGCFLGVGAGGFQDLGNTLNGIQITNSPNNVIGGLDPTNRNVISGNNASGINLGGAGATNNSILGNYIGFNTTNGVTGNSADGIRVNAPFNIIGGSASGAGNIIAGNTGDGIEVMPQGVETVIKGNFIGTSGTVDFGNTLDGILVSARAVLIGGSSAGERNLISGNNSDGIQIDGTNAIVIGNFIGTTVSGATGIPNTIHGIFINANSRSNIIGGLVAGAGNLIAFNTQDGINVTAAVTSTNHAFRANLIHSNGDLGIDLGNPGVTFNDAGDADTGANNLQNFPVLLAVTNTLSGTEFVGSLNSRPSTTYNLDFYCNVLPDISGHGEGQVYLGSTNVNTDVGGNVAFDVTLPATNLLGRYITATATDPSGNTSEFATNILAASTVPGLTFTVVNTNDSGAGSLRQAILDANATAINSGDTIAFAITNLSTTISPASALPTIIDPVTIDGYTQPGAATNTSSTAFNGTLLVRLSGVSAGSGVNGLLITSGNSTVRGLIITGFNGDGIELSGFPGNIIEGCIVGLDAAGTDQGNGANGIFVTGCSNNIIGGSGPGSRNVISGNQSDGVEINGLFAKGNQVIGNLIGSDHTGTTNRNNSADGVLVMNALGNFIGGSAPGAGNLLSGNSSDGVEINGLSSSNNVVLGNRIGTDVSGTVSRPNNANGVLVSVSARNNIVGGINPGEANIIAFNGSDGIATPTSIGNTNNTYRGNSIFSNSGLGLNLGTAGVTANDPGDPDTGGGNQSQNFPVLASVTNTLTDVIISGSLNSRPSVTYTLDFYSSVAFDPTGVGEGQTWMGATNLATGADSNLTFAISLPVTNLQGRYVTATATDDFGNTSEFSTNVTAVSTVPGLIFTVVNTNNSGAGSLRQAIIDANAAITAGDRIEFAITNVSTINRPSSALPAIIDPVTIDGYTQPGSATNSSPTAFTGTLLVKLDGVNAGNTDGLAFTVGNNTVRGLNIINFLQDGLDFSSCSNNLIEGCVIGLDLNNTDAGNGVDGIRLLNSGFNVIGGTGPGSRNVISGNNARGIEIGGAGSIGNEILGNLIGTGLLGTNDLGNSIQGIIISSAGSTTIGGASPAARNIISGNNFPGIDVSSTTSPTTIRNNYIGTDITGTLDLGNIGDGITINASTDVTVLGNLISGNSGDGIEITGVGATNNVVQDNRIGTDVTGTNAQVNGNAGVNLSNGSRLNRIGGTSAGEPNIIAFNLDDGITVASGTNNVLRGNSIFSNGNAVADLGIDLGTSGVTANDIGDADTGANQQQNFPVITSVLNTPSGTTINGTLNSATNRDFTLDFYSSTAFHSSGNGEGQTWLGSTNLTTDASGSNVFSLFLAVTNLAGRYITATATDTNGNTSEFSVSVAAVSTFPGLTFTVVNTNNSGAGSLRQAILDANAAITAGDTIAFAITNTGSPKTIHPTGSGFPVISDSVTIDGYTQPGSVTNNSPTAFNGTMMVRLDGSSLGGGSDGLNFTVGNNTVRGLVIIRFLGPGSHGLEFNGGGNNVVQGNLIGIDVDSNFLGNTDDGVRLNNSTNNLIGGTSAGHRNVLSANASDGVEINGVASSNNVVQGNVIGLDLVGSTPRGNGGSGVFLNAAPGNLIGGTAPGARNVISENVANGVTLQTAGATNNSIVGNYIGTDVTGALARGNDTDGILINNVSGNIIGGSTPAARNVISGSNSDGIALNSAGANNNLIRGNYIGTDATGLLDRGNLANGVLISGAPFNTIGGATAAEGNLISGNQSDGIEITGLGASTNTVRNNRIGIDAAGIAGITNNGHGVFITTSAHHNEIGGGNAIAFSGLDGVYVASGGSNALRQNLIFSNGGLGIDLGTDGVTTNDLNDADIGANLLQNFPVLSAATNSLAGVSIAGSLNSAINSSFELDFFASTTGDTNGFGEGQVYLGSTNVTTDGSGNASFLASFPVVVTGRYITATATDTNGNTSEFSSQIIAASTIPPTNILVTTVNDSGTGSLREAILIANTNISDGNDIISFAIPGAGPHTIAPTSLLPVIIDPVTIDGYTQSGATQNNSCVSNNAVLQIRLSGANAGFGADGLQLQGVGGSIVRGLCIGGFTDNGIEVSIGRSNVIEGCFIGIDVDGVSSLPNGNNGVRLSNASTSGNRVGGSTAAARNVISANANGGIQIFFSPSNVVSGNLIGTDRTGTLDRGNEVTGVNVFGATATHNVIGGTSACERNVISGNGGFTFSIYHGVELSSVSHTRIQGNYIGLSADGAQSLGNASDGIHLSGSSFNVIGGATAAERNVISGNQTHGIELESTSPSNTISGNFIGTDATGTLDRGNAYYGVIFAGARSNLFSGNVISGNDNSGVYVAGNASPGNRLLGNSIGTDITGALNLGNLGFGLFIEQSDTQVGGTNINEGNVIAFNPTGVFVGSSVVRVPILGNLIYSNNIQGIELYSGNFGVEPNDPGDLDSGANNLQNYPVLAQSAESPTDTTISGTLNSRSNATYRIEFFNNVATDSTGFGEGQIFLGFTNVTTDSSGNASFIYIHPASLPFGNYITTTATDSANNTSEFSGASRVVPFDSVNLDVTLTDSSDPAAHVTNLFYTITITNGGPTNATGVFATNTLPAGVVFVNATSSQGSCTHLSGIVTCNLGTITNGGSVTVQIEVATTITGSVFDSVTVSAAELDHTPANNSDGEFTFLGIANIAITIADSPDPVVAGQLLTNVITISNFGPDSATLVNASFDLAPSAVPITTSASQGSFTQTGNFFSFAAGTIPAFGSAQLTVVGIPTQNGVITHYANASAPESDLFSSNNFTDQNTTVSVGPGVIQFASASFTSHETGFNAPIIVVRTGGAIGSVTVDFNTSNGSATTGLDFSNTVQTLSFTNGELVKYFYVPVIDDLESECNEFFNVSLSNPSGGAVVIGTTQAVVTIIENDLSLGGNVHIASGSVSNLPSFEGSGNSFNSSVSADGRYVVFSSYADNLVIEDGNFSADMFVRDLLAQTTTLVSYNQTGLSSGNGDSDQGSVSGNGRYVVFNSNADDLVSNDANGSYDVFVRDLLLGTTTLASVNAAGASSGDNSSFMNGRSIISSNGQRIVYYSYASNLSGTSDTNFTGDVFLFDLAGNSNQLISVNLAGTSSANNGAYDPVISANGQVVAFYSYADDLVGGDLNNRQDVFVRDTATASNELVSVNLSGTSANSDSYIARLSASGRYVAFLSYATDLTTNSKAASNYDVYWRDRVAGVTRLVSVDSNGISAGNNISTFGGISADGRYVVFASHASNLVPNDNNGTEDVFVRDMISGTTTLVSVNAGGTGSSEAQSRSPVISGDGTHVAFESYSTNLTTATKVPFITDVFVRNLISNTTRLVSFRETNTNSIGGAAGDEAISFNGNVTSFTAEDADVPSGLGVAVSPGYDIWAHNLAGNTTELVTIASPGHSGNGVSYGPAVSGDGLWVAYVSSANNLVTNDVNNDTDIFIMNLTTYAIELISRNAGVPGNNYSENPSVSFNGNRVVFESGANNLANNDTNSSQDIFVRDRVAGTNILVSVKAAGSGSANGYSFGATISPDGRHVAFHSYASDLVNNDTNNTVDVFVRDLLTGTTTLVSHNLSGTSGGNSSSSEAVIDTDPLSGRVFVAYLSFASNLVNNDSNNTQDVFLFDLTTGSNRLVSVNMIGGSGSQFSSNPRLAVNSASSNVFVAYSSYAANLVNNDTNSSSDVFVYDLLSGTNRLVSVNVAGTGSANGFSVNPSISASGRYVAFESSATNLSIGDTNQDSDVFLRDLVSNTTTLITANCDGTASARGSSYEPVISADGAYVSYISTADDLVAGDFTLLVDNIFRYDRVSGATTLVSQNQYLLGGGNEYSSAQRISSNGTTVVFSSVASDLIVNDGNGTSDVFAWQAGAAAPLPDLVLDKSASSGSVSQFASLTYTITVTNFGAASAAGVNVSDVLPANLSFVSAISSQGSVTNAGNTVTATVGSLGAGAGVSIAINVTAMTAGNVTNSASASANEADASPASNTDSVVVTVTPLTPPTLSIGITNGPKLMIRWPSSTPNVFAVQTATNLKPVITWTTITNSIFDNGTFKFVLINTNQAEPTRFYRLKY